MVVMLRQSLETVDAIHSNLPFSLFKCGLPVSARPLKCYLDILNTVLEATMIPKSLAMDIILAAV